MPVAGLGRYRVEAVDLVLVFVRYGNSRAFAAIVGFGVLGDDHLVVEVLVVGSVLRLNKTIISRVQGSGYRHDLPQS